MGWTYVHRDPGMSDRGFFQGQFGQHVEILAAGTRDNVCYMACRHPHIPEQGTFAVVCLIDRFGDRRDPYFSFGYKDMDETMGPNEQDCPPGVYALLTPLEESGLSGSTLEYAQGWRDGVEGNIARRSAASAVKRGDIVEFPSPIRFSTGEEISRLAFVERDTFELAPEPGKAPYRSYRRFRISGWRTREFTHIPA